MFEIFSFKNGHDLRVAVRSQDIEKVKSIIANLYKQLNEPGAEQVGDYIDLHGDRGRTAMHFATMNLHPIGGSPPEEAKQILKILKENGGSLLSKDDKGKTPLQVAVEFKCFQFILKLFHEQYDLFSEEECNEILERSENSNYMNNIELAASMQPTDFLQAVWGGERKKIQVYLAAHKNDPETYLNIKASETFKIGIFDNGQNALHISACKRSGNSLEIAKDLLDAGFDITTKSSTGSTALHIAAINNSLHIATLLIEHKSDIDAEDKYLNTPLHCAASKGYKEIVELLLAHDANVFKTKISKQTAAQVAEEYGHRAIAACIREVEFQKIVRSMTPADFLQAVFDRNRGKVKAYLTLHRNDPETYLNVKSSMRWESDRFLREANALHIASYRSEAIAKDLLAAGFDVMARTVSHSSTALHLASQADALGIAEILLEHKSDIDAQDCFLDTPLHWAAYKGHEAMVKLLLAHGANVLKKNKDGKTAFMLAEENGFREIAKTLKNAEIAQLVTQAIEAGCVNEIDDNKESILFHAVRHGDHESVKRLLENGADISLKNHEEKTVYDYAKESKFPEIRLLLLEAKIVALEPLANLTPQKRKRNDVDINLPRYLSHNYPIIPPEEYVQVYSFLDVAKPLQEEEKPEAPGEDYFDFIPANEEEASHIMITDNSEIETPTFCQVQVPFLAGGNGNFFKSVQVFLEEVVGTPCLNTVLTSQP
ncbi:MAG: ankyrin repeat domain-containing protein [Gammaproteobacteria bacterium]|nr:ankyrin repeat domain-containing protein [Gammaproteobacteria bacterium]